MKKTLLFMTLLFTSFFVSGCTEEEVIEETTELEIMEYEEALEIFAEGKTATILDIETGTTYEVRRVEGGYTTIADVEALTLEDTESLLSTTDDNDWSVKRRAVLVYIGDYVIPASIAPYEHGGSEDEDYGIIIDNRSGSTGTGINLDYIRDNGMIGVVDIYFYNSLVPGISRIDERHQEKVLEAAEYANN